MSTIGLTVTSSDGGSAPDRPTGVWLEERKVGLTDASACVQIIRTAGVCGRVGSIWTSDCCHDVATAVVS